MKEGTPYAVIWREMQRQLDIGAVTKRGRPPSDPEAVVFKRELRAWKLALKEMPADLRNELKRGSVMFKGLAKANKTYCYQERARVRAEGRLQAGIADCEPTLTAQRILRSEATNDRRVKVAFAMQNLEAKKQKVNAKTVSIEVTLLFKEVMPVALDTTRKDIAKIRRDRHT